MDDHPLERSVVQFSTGRQDILAEVLNDFPQFRDMTEIRTRPLLFTSFKIPCSLIILLSKAI